MWRRVDVYNIIVIRVVPTVLVFFQMIFSLHYVVKYAQRIDFIIFLHPEMSFVEMSVSRRVLLCMFAHFNGSYFRTE